MEVPLNDILKSINECNGSIESEFDELEERINSVEFNSLPCSILDDLIKILDKCIKNNEIKLKQNEIKEVSPSSYIQDLYDNYGSCSEYELKLHKIIRIMIKIVENSNISLSWSECSSKTIILLIKNLKLYIRFVLIDFLNILLKSNRIKMNFIYRLSKTFFISV